MEQKLHVHHSDIIFKRPDTVACYVRGAITGQLLGTLLHLPNYKICSIEQSHHGCKAAGFVVGQRAVLLTEHGCIDTSRGQPTPVFITAIVPPPYRRVTADTRIQDLAVASSRHTDYPYINVLFSEILSCAPEGTKASLELVNETAWKLIVDTLEARRIWPTQPYDIDHYVRPVCKSIHFTMGRLHDTLRVQRNFP